MPPLQQDVQELPLTPIQSFYSGANVFITGGTGFLGQLLVEKLLRSCPDIRTIYLLVRKKEKKDMMTRIDEILDECIFDKLKTICPKYKYKVIGVEGDCTLPNLGINEQDRTLLASEISVVFHSAATVNFNEKLKTAVDINVRGTKELLDFCKDMPKLKAVVHISTAFCNCTEEIIDEKIVQTKVGYKDLFTLTETLDETALTRITPHMLGNLPNTYTFTKRVTENMICEEGKNLPLGIYRPSIVISTYKEPLRGWINNMYGAVGVAAGSGTGVLRVIHCDGQASANLVPADMCVNGLIAVAWEIEQKFMEAKQNATIFEIPIYNYESSIDQPLCWDRYLELTSTYGVIKPYLNSVWYFCLSLIKNKRLYQLAAFLVHTVPAFIVDGLLFVTGRRRRFMKLYSKIHQFCDLLSYFSTKSFKFKSTRVRNLISRMSERDQEIFFCDLKRLDWEDYFKDHFLGVRQYILKDPPSTLPEALKRYNRLYWLHQVTKLVISLTLMRMFWSIISYVILFISRA